MSLQFAELVNTQNPELLEANTHQSCAYFLYKLCTLLGPEWRLLSKTPGENGYTWGSGIRTSHDAICRVNPQGAKVECFDVISGAGDPGRAGRPAWMNIVPEHWRASNLPVRPQEALGEVSTPTPTPTPGLPPAVPPAPPSTPLATTQAQIAEIHAALPELLRAAKAVNWLARVNNWPID